MLTAKRPGTGLSPMLIMKVVNKYKKKFKKNEMIK